MAHAPNPCGKDIDTGARENRPKRWKEIWSAGHSTSGVSDVLSVDELVARTLAEYREAAARAGLRQGDTLAPFIAAIAKFPAIKRCSFL